MESNETFILAKHEIILIDKYGRHPILIFYPGTAEPYCRWKEIAERIVDMLNAKA